ncbi:unnamed protein product [Phytophthora fragariaefolia]|uniref:Unnamed protein product n=1 Tax=Phytophthora fragariaefolia TaxID=1490495 RepID=A0A9W6YK09_9STRA|nr:unnamed protein product [Phytophthora fragariaefolia]
MFKPPIGRQGFAFLQYEDPADAATAIEKLDHLKLEDGHILKVTVAKERPAGGNGKLKRDQHARQDLDEKAEGGLREVDARLPGKRQRSSPPVAALPLGPSRLSPAFLLDKHRLEGFVAATAQKETPITQQLTSANTIKDESMDPEADQKQVKQVICGMLDVVEQSAQIKFSANLFAAYQRVMLTPSPESKKKRGGNLSVLVPGSKSELEEENSTDSLASSIRSVSLAATPMTIRGSPLDSFWTPKATREGGAMPPPRSKHHLRRRRQSLDGSGSSTEDGSDGSGIRRKRSNTTTSPPPTLNAQPRGSKTALSPPRKNSDRSDISLSPDALKAEIISKKLCKRQSSDNAIEESYRVAKHQATRERKNHDSNVVERGYDRPCITGIDSSYDKHRNIKVEFKPQSPEPARDLQSHHRAKPENALNSVSMSGNPSQKMPEFAASAAISDGRKDRLWVLLLYDRFLATHMLSSVVSSLLGMEFMDIKVVKSTGEAQGVAFVKFDTETNATQAALQLHQMELPLGSGKFLQAIVILEPSLFTTTHGNNSFSTNDSMRLDRTSGERVVTGSSEDVDLSAVEARFAHLMRSTEHQHTREGYYLPQYSSISPRESMPNAPGQLSSIQGGMYPPSHSAGCHASLGISAGVEYYPMQLVPYPPTPQQPFPSYANYGGPASYQQVPQPQGFSGSVPGWMNTSPYYQGGVPQYPFSCAPEHDMALPLVNNSNSPANCSDAYAAPPKPRSLRSHSEQMDIEDGTSSCSSQTSYSVYVSTGEPLELATLVNALQDCPGVVSFTKDVTAAADLTGYTVDFVSDAQALAAVRKLDGSLCGGQKLRVVKSPSTIHRGADTEMNEIENDIRVFAVSSAYGLRNFKATEIDF